MTSHSSRGAGAMDDTLRERLLKVLALARGGVGGEKENAEVLLKKLLAKHNLTMEVLEEHLGERRQVMQIAFTGDLEKMILRQLIARMVGFKREVALEPAGDVTPADILELILGNDPKCPMVFALLVTPGERAALTVAWDVYLAAWKLQLGDMANAFVWRHHLYDECQLSKDGVEPELTEEQKAAQRRAGRLAGALEHVEDPAPRLTAGEAPK